MDKDNFTSFDDYKDKMIVIPKKVIKVDKNKILADAEKIKKLDQER